MARFRVDIGERSGPAPAWVLPGADVEAARFSFLTTLNFVGPPEVFDRLRDVAPYFDVVRAGLSREEQECLGNADSADSVLGALFCDLDQRIGAAQSAERDWLCNVHELRDRLRSWAENYNLAAEWTIHAALETLSFLETKPESRGIVCHYRGSPSLLHIPPFTFTSDIPPPHFTPSPLNPLYQNLDRLRNHYAWYPDIEARPAFEERMRAQFKAKLRAYCDEREQQAPQLGLVPATEAPAAQKNPETFERHLEWLVRYQVLKDDFALIAREERTPHQAVQTAVKAAARLIGLPLRERSRGGRPRNR